MSQDIAVGTVGLPAVGSVLKKPNYLVKLYEGKTQFYFMCLEKPVFENGFVQAKGYYIEDADVSHIPDKDEIVEMYFPNNLIINIKNLAYKSK